MKKDYMSLLPQPSKSGNNKKLSLFVMLHPFVTKEEHGDPLFTRTFPFKDDQDASAFFNWPDVLEKMTFELITVSYETKSEPKPDPNNIALKRINSKNVDSTLWGKIFHKAVDGSDYQVVYGNDVTPKKAKYNVLDSHSHVLNINGIMTDCYNALLAEGELPTKKVLEIITKRRKRSQFVATAPRNVGPNMTVMNPADFLDASKKVRKMGFGSRSDQNQKPLEFHAITSALGSYPVLLRKLGLLLDFEVPDWGTRPEFGKMKIYGYIKNNPYAGLEIESFWVEYNFEKNKTGLNLEGVIPDGKPSESFSFQDPKNKNSQNNKILKKSFKTITQDPVQLYLQHGQWLTKLDQATLANDKSNVEIPTFPTSGIAIILPNKQNELGDFNDYSSNKTGTFDKPFIAFQLINGYKVYADTVLNDKMKSLCDRRGDFSLRTPKKFDPISIDPNDLNDFGWVATVPTEGNLSSDGKTTLNFPDILMMWKGNSLVAEMGVSKYLDKTGRLSSIRNDEDSHKYPVLAKFIPRNLPTLRFNHEYFIRIVPVDLAGNEHNLTYFNSQKQIQEVCHMKTGLKRSEGVNSPVLMEFKTNPSQAQSQDTLVLRTMDDGPFVDSCSRYILPPNTSVEMALMHGLFDISKTQNRPDPNKYDQIIDHTSILSKLAKSQDCYLPDPWAVGVTISGLPKGDGTKVSEKYNFHGYPAGGGQWPNILPLKLVVIRSNGSQKYASYKFSDTEKDPNLGIIIDKLEIILPVGESLDLEISSIMPPEVIKKQWAPIHFLNLDRTAFKKGDALKHLVNAASGTRKVRLIHACQKPAMPSFEKMEFTVNRVSSSNDATIFDANNRLNVDGKSTEKITLTAKWEDWRDINDVSDGHSPPVKVDTHQQNYPINVYQGWECVNSFVQPFDSGKHYNISYEARAVTRYKELLPIFLRDKVVTTELTKKDAVVHVLCNFAPPPPQVDESLSGSPLFKWEKTDYIDPNGTDPKTTKHVFISTRTFIGLRVYLKRPWFVSSNDEMLGIVLSPDGCNKYSVNDANADMFSRWGYDPVNSGSDNPDQPKCDYLNVDHFNPNEIKQVKTVQLKSGQIKVLGLEVDLKKNWDSDNRCWFVDIQMTKLNKMPYSPFVQINLVRFNPHVQESQLGVLSELAVSSIVTLKAQLLPERTTEFVRTTKYTSPASPETIINITIIPNTWQKPTDGPSGVGNKKGNTVRCRFIRAREGFWPLISGGFAYPGPENNVLSKNVDLIRDETTGRWSVDPAKPVQWENEFKWLLVEEVENYHSFYPPAAETVYGERLVYADVLDFWKHG